MKTFALRALVCALLCALLPAIALPGTAQAVGVGNPVIVSPNSTVPNGFSDPVMIDFSDAPAASYEVTIASDDFSVYQFDWIAYDGVTDVVSVALNDAPLPAGNYQIDVTDYDGHTAYSTFTVAPPPPPVLTIGNVTLSPTTFYPLVRDAYRDTTRIRYRLNRSARVTARVVNSNGTVIRRVDLGTRNGSQSWAWNGKKTSGARATTGYFNIKITATVTAAPASTKSVVRRVRLATRYITSTVTKRRTGYNTSSDSHTASCYVDYFYYTDEVDLDCWGGSYAKVNYRFAIPSNAYNIRWGVTGFQGCCSTGVIAKTGTRPTSRSYRVSVKVTNWRSYSVQGVRVTYTSKRRI